MKPKATAKMLIDVAMTVLLVCLMAYQIVGEFWHEWIGAAVFVLFIAHHLLNLSWYKRLFKGAYTPYRAVTTAVDFLVLICMLGLMVSSVILSQHVFAFLNITGGMMFGRTVHLLCSYWGFVLMSAHLGMHWGMMLGMGKKALGIKAASAPVQIAARIIAAAVAVFGVYSFITEQLASYMFLRTQFVFFDYSASAFTVFAKYISMMVLFALIAYYAAKLLQKCGAKKEAVSK